MVEFTRQRLGDRRGLTLDRSTMRDQAGPILPDRCFRATSGLPAIHPVATVNATPSGRIYHLDSSGYIVA